MNDGRRLIRLNGRLISTPLTDFWQISQTVQDPSIPNLPLTTPAGGAAAQTLTQSATYANSNTFYTHVLTQPAPSQTLTQSARHDNSNAFYSHALTASIALTQSSRFDNAPTFYAHTLTPGAVGLIQSARYDNAATFYAHTLTPGAVALAQSARFDNDATFYSHTLNQAGGTQNLTQGTIFENENTFFAHTVTTVEVAVPGPRRYSGVGYLVDDGKKRETITLYDEEAEILELLAAIMPVIHEQQQRRMTT